MNEFTIAIITVILLLIINLLLLKKTNSRVKDIAIKVELLNEKINSEANLDDTELYEHVNMNDTELYELAKEIAEKRGVCSASLLQRTLKIGFVRAMRLVDTLEENGLLEPATGVNPRKYIRDKDKDR
jgi:DNA segregation ATPase FtsK/SpoIIIE-like protein